MASSCGHSRYRICRRWLASAALSRGYYFGGESQAKSSVLGDVLRLDPRATAWTAAAPLPTPRNFARAVVFNGRVYVIGGSTGYGSSHASVGSRTVESFRP